MGVVRGVPRPVHEAEDKGLPVWLWVESLLKSDWCWVSRGLSDLKESFVHGWRWDRWDVFSFPVAFWSEWVGEEMTAGDPRVGTIA